MVRQLQPLEMRVRVDAEVVLHRLSEVLSRNATLHTVYEFREKLRTLWSTANVSNERLVQQLKDWCAEAEASGIQVLEDFAARLRSYRMATA